jgi:hypothetical protein
MSITGRWYQARQTGHLWYRGKSSLAPRLIPVETPLLRVAFLDWLNPSLQGQPFCLGLEKIPRQSAVVLAWMAVYCWPVAAKFHWQ